MDLPIDGGIRRCDHCVAPTDLFRRLEESGQLLRIDPSVTPTTYRCATVSGIELDHLRRIENVVRMGRVRRIGTDAVVLQSGSVPTDHFVRRLRGRSRTSHPGWNGRD